MSYQIKNTFAFRLIAPFEGFRSKPYQCRAGKWTIGYGHTDGVTKNTQQISLATAQRYLDGDIDYFRNLLLQKYIEYSIFDNEQLAPIISLVFNIGINNFDKYSVSSLLAVIASCKKNHVDYISELLLHLEESWLSICKYHNANGQLVHSKGLFERRITEYKHFKKSIL